ncbi:MAG: LysM peptidoglycan-binding domain-containing protein [Bacteroidales bacterium]|nr:LysM peptidoglycan-binding domain-containing protein [Bacteroidales bacterium]
MKRLLLTIITFSLFASSLAAQKVTENDSTVVVTSQTTETKQDNFFKKIFPPKEERRSNLLKQRDSLFSVNDSLLRVIDTLRMEINDYELITSSDTLNSGTLDLETPDYVPSDSLTLADTDSLMSIWYHQKDLELIENLEKDVDLDTAVLLSNIPDSIYIDRLQKMNSFISVPYNSIIRNYIITYTERIAKQSETMLGLCKYYMPIIEEIFDQYQLPLELKAMAIIESALNPRAVSRVKAKGMWQFMYGTAIRYNLLINSFVDERLDPVKSCHAAARYLQDAYRMFGSWPLAIASYNCGAGNVNKAIRRAGGSKEIWDVYPFLPRETRGYIPSFIAALYMMNYYQEHQLTPVAVNMPVHTDTIKVTKMLHFDQVTHFTGISKKELQDLNPQYLHDIVPGVEREYILRIPYNYTGKFVENEDSIYKYKDSLYFSPATLKKIKESGSTNSQRITHKVKSGETLSHIAIKYGVKVKDIQRWNGVKNNIRIGQKLVIYKGGGPAASTKSSGSSKAKTTTSGGYVIYTVQSGDNLWDIAKKFPGVSAQNIMDLNGMNKGSKIYPGMKLKIKKSN